MGLVGFRSWSSSYTMGIPVGRFSSMMACSDIPEAEEVFLAPSTQCIQTGLCGPWYWGAASEPVPESKATKMYLKVKGELATEIAQQKDKNTLRE